jgi:hypothetical protein
MKAAVRRPAAWTSLQPLAWRVRPRVAARGCQRRCASGGASAQSTETTAARKKLDSRQSAVEERRCQEVAARGRGLQSTPSAAGHEREEVSASSRRGDIDRSRRVR